MKLKLTKEFLDDIKEPKTNWVLFVGAGLSISQVRKDGKGIPDWENLMSLMIEDIENSNKCDKRAIKKLKDFLDKKEYLKIADKFEEIYPKTEYSINFLKEHLYPNDIVSSKIHEIALKTNFRGIITTNFDCVFERQKNFSLYNYIRDHVVYPDLINEHITWLTRTGFFLKIHGCIEKNKKFSKFILTKRNFDYINSNKRYLDILRTIFYSNRIIIVGYSLNDPDFQDLIKYQKEVFKGYQHTVYALLKDFSYKDRNKWRKYKIEILPYENHDELLEFFIKTNKLLGDRTN